MVVCAEYVREYLFTVIHSCLLRGAVLKGLEVVVAVVNGAALADAEHLLISVGPEERNNNRTDSYYDNKNGAYGCDLVFQKAFYAVFEEGGGGTHLCEIFLVLR